LNSCIPWPSLRTLNTAIKQEKDLKGNLDNIGIDQREGIITVMLGGVWRSMVITTICPIAKRAPQ